MQQQKEHFKYKIIAHVVKLHLNKNLNFETKITWKRNVNKTQTQTVTHDDCHSIFDQTLELELNLVYNQHTNQFQNKLTQFGIVVIYQGKIKSGGNVRYDVADVVNNNFNNQTVKLSLSQCPDPAAYLQVIFDYEVVSQSSHSLFNELSMLNPAGFQQDLSQIDFKEEKEESRFQKEESQKQLNLNLRQEIDEEKENVNDMPLREKELSKINNILDKFESVSRKLATSPKACLQDQNSTKLSSTQTSTIPSEQEQSLQNRVNELESELELKNALLEDYQKKLETANRTLEELELKNELSGEKIRELESKSKLDRIDQSIVESEKKYREGEQRYRQLYQQTLNELEEVRHSASSEANFSKQHKDFNKFVEEVHRIDEVPEFQVETTSQPTSRLNEAVQQLQRQNIELQSKIASSTLNVAQLFNAAYEFGGAKLLDYLQNSIGLIEQAE